MRILAVFFVVLGIGWTAQVALGADAAPANVSPSPTPTPTLTSAPDESDFSNWIHRNAYADLYGYVGYSSPTIPAISSAQSEVLASNPTLLQWGLGLTFDYKIAELTDFEGVDIFAGLSTDFRQINQYSSVDPAIGNSRGKRWTPLMPSFAFRFQKGYVFKIDFQFLGNYVLSNPTAEGSKLTYGHPLGARIMALYPMEKLLSFGSLRHVFVGLESEYVKYSQRVIENVSQETLSPALSIWQMGVTVSYVF